MKRAVCPLALLCLLLAVSGCAQRIGAFTMASTKNVNVPAKRWSEQVEGEHATFFGQPSIEEAVDRAIEKKPGADALIDVVIWYSPGLFRNAFKVEGTPISTQQFESDLLDSGMDPETVAATLATVRRAAPQPDEAAP